jgi:hypothetical protein
MATRHREWEVRKKYWKETVIVIKWTAFHEYCNVGLYLHNLIFVLVAYEAVLHWFYTTERGLKRGRFYEKMEQFFFVLLTTVSTIYILSSSVILQCLKDSHQEDSQNNNLFLEPIILKTPKLKAPFQTSYLWQTWWHTLCPRPHICVTDCNSTIHIR